MERLPAQRFESDQGPLSSGPEAFPATDPCGRREVQPGGGLQSSRALRLHRGAHPDRRSNKLWTDRAVVRGRGARSEAHTSELQSLMRISYAVFCLTHKYLLLSFLYQFLN